MTEGVGVGARRKRKAGLKLQRHAIAVRLRSTKSWLRNHGTVIEVPLLIVSLLSILILRSPFKPSRLQSDFLSLRGEPDAMVGMRLNAVDGNKMPGKTELSVDRIDLFPGILRGAARACVTDIKVSADVKEPGPSNTGGSGQLTSDGVRPRAELTTSSASPDRLCIDAVAHLPYSPRALYTVSWSIDARGGRASGPVFYNYPFDSMEIDLSALVYITQFDDNDNQIGTYQTFASISMLPNLVDWHGHVVVHKHRFISGEQPNGALGDTGIVFERPVGLKVLVLTVMASLLVSVGIVPIVKEIGAASQLWLALVIGIFGVRSAILPQDAQMRSNLDAILLGMFVVLSVTMVGKYFTYRVRPQPP